MSNIFTLLGIDAADDDIDLNMTPIDTFGLFECRGDMHRVRSRKERYYHFYIDNWNKPASLCFMERGIRHAQILARINAPQEMINACVVSQNSFAIHNTAQIL